ncbi:MAG: HIT family protein [Lachnospiraceae bacterium]|nr:HIT family protein [Lachnospiraceae bacterium]
MEDNKICSCVVCERIALTKQGRNPYFVRELETGYVVIGDHQRFKGYTLFLCKKHATEIHFLDKEFRSKFLQEMSLVAEATYNAFKPDKLNYELLGVGNGVHMHWHFFPRRDGDTPTPGPVWKLDKAEMNHNKYLPTEDERKELISKLNDELSKLLYISLSG